MLIAVEGMDGVGKTEVSKYICEKYNFTFIEKPLHYFYNDGAEKKYADLMKVANRMYEINDDVLKSWYIALGNIYVARMFQNENIVIDRHLVSNYYWNGSIDSDPVFKALIETCGTPDLTILLYATPKTRMERLRKRDKNDPDLDDPEKKDDGFKKMIYFLESFNLPYIVIDTENTKLEEVEQVVDEEILKLKSQQRALVKKKNLLDEYK